MEFEINGEIFVVVDYCVDRNRENLNEYECDIDEDGNDVELEPCYYETIKKTVMLNNERNNKQLIVSLENEEKFYKNLELNSVEKILTYVFKGILEGERYLYDSIIDNTISISREFSYASNIINLKDMEFEDIKAFKESDEVGIEDNTSYVYELNKDTNKLEIPAYLK